MEARQKEPIIQNTYKNYLLNVVPEKNTSWRITKLEQYIMLYTEISNEIRLIKQQIEILRKQEAEYNQTVLDLNTQINKINLEKINL